jgi:tetratricopeptide (TPR) repeat protein
MAQIFLSYDRRDETRAESVAALLERSGHSVWWDRHIKGGRQFASEIEQALEAADVVIVLWSAHSIKSDWVKDEAAAGRDRGRMVPVTLDGTPPPLGFRQYQTVDLSAPSGSGNRLEEAIAAVIDGSASSPSGTARPMVHTTRRRILAGGAIGLAAVAAGGGIWRFLVIGKEPPAEVKALLAQAWQAWTQGTRDSNAQAIGLYRRAIQISPTYADAWGLLSCAYGDRGHGLSGAERAATWQRAREAGQRALSLDPHNAYGRIGVAYARPLRGNWALMEQEFRKAEEAQPGKFLVNYSLGLLLGDVGRFAEAARLFGGLKGTAPTAFQYLWHSQALWASGKPDEADRLIEEAASIYGSHPAIWRQRFDMALHSGRATTAIALAEDTQGRPDSIDEDFLQVATAAARASLTGGASAVGSVKAQLNRYVRKSVSAATVSIQLAVLLRQLDAAFDYAGALFTSAGFSIPDFAPRDGAAPAVTLDERRSRLLFLPSTAGMRTDARFDRLTEAVGLNRYWRESGSLPDYRMQ